MAQLITKLGVSNWNHMYWRPLKLTVGESANLQWKCVLSKSPHPKPRKNLLSDLQVTIAMMFSINTS